MPKYKVTETEVGPKRVFCPKAYKEKAVFPNYNAALSFIQEQADGFTRHMGTFARSVYYCPDCDGWHLTKQVPMFADSVPGVDAAIIGGVVYTPRRVAAGVNGCDLCDIDVVRKCREGGFMPCLAYKDDVYMHKADLLMLARRIYKKGEE